MTTTNTNLSELDTKMDFWIKNNLNVLLEGQQGVGKSTIIEAMVKRNNLSYKYFTASLMDPYLTLIGVPKEGKDQNGESFLDFIKPSEFADDSVEFIFLDEFNRAPPSVRNAVMELIQFKSINGRKLKNLKAVWAAINPYDDNETFNVQELDPAQKDRFHVFYQLPFEPSAEYFTSKFGQHMSNTAIKWWGDIPEDIRNEVSPRRLDYALEMYQLGGDVEDVLTPLSRPETLIRKLQDFTGGEGTYIERWMTDSESFLEEITSRTTPTEVDVVTAFAELRKYSMDMAVDYVGKLLPDQLNLIRESEQIEIMLRNYNGPKTPAVESSLSEQLWHSQHIQFVFDSVKDKASAKFTKMFDKEDFEGMCAEADTGFEYAVVMCIALRDQKEDFPYDRIKGFLDKKPALLKYLSMCSFEHTAKLLEMG